MENFELDRKIIEKINSIKKNKEMISVFTEKKRDENIASKIANENPSLNTEDVLTIISLYKQITKEYNSELKPYKETNDLLTLSIGEDIIDDYKEQGIDDHLLLQTEKYFPQIGKIKVKSERNLFLSDNEEIRQNLVKKLAKKGKTEYLDINPDAYFEASKQYYAKNKKHLEGVFESTPSVSVSITFPKK